MVNLSKSYPFKCARAGDVFLFWLDSSSAYGVDAEWDSPSTESTQSETPCQLSQCRMRLCVNWVNTEGTNIYEDFIISRWFSQRGVSLRVQLTWSLTWHWLNWRRMSHCQMLKYSNKSANSRTKLKTFKSLIFRSIYVYILSVQKTRTKKSHASVLFSLPYSCLEEQGCVSIASMKSVWAMRR